MGRECILPKLTCRPGRGGPPPCDCSGQANVGNPWHARSKHEYVSPYCIATIYTTLGSKEQAFSWLEKAFEDRAHGLVYLKVEPRFDSLGAPPRLQSLLRRMNFPT